mgnify:CR=1 FL=1
MPSAAGGGGGFGRFARKKKQPDNNGAAGVVGATANQEGKGPNSQTADVVDNGTSPPPVVTTANENGEEERPSTAFATTFQTDDISRPATSGSNNFSSIDNMFDHANYNADDAGLTDDVVMDGGEDNGNANAAAQNLLFFTATPTEGMDSGVGGGGGVDAMMMGPSQEFGASPFGGGFDGFGELGSGGEAEQQQQPVVEDNGEEVLSLNCVFYLSGEYIDGIFLSYSLY